MSTDAAGRTIDFRILLSRSFEHLWLIRKQVLGYIGIFVVIAFVSPLLGVGGGGGFLVAYLVGQYWLYHSLLKARGLLETSRYHYFAFVGLALVLIVPILVGLTAFVLPGLFLISRWIIAPALVVTRGLGSFAAAIESWYTVRGYTGQVAGAAAVMLLIGAAIVFVTGAIEGQFATIVTYRGAKPIDAIEFHIIPLLLLGLSTATYELLGPQDTMIEEVFG